MQYLSTGTWASVDERCPMSCKVEGSDLATVVIGGDGQGVELTFNSAGLLRLAEVSTQAVAEMDALEVQGPTERQTTGAGAASVGGTPC